MAAVAVVDMLDAFGRVLRDQFYLLIDRLKRPLGQVWHEIQQASLIRGSLACGGRLAMLTAGSLSRASRGKAQAVTRDVSS